MQRGEILPTIRMRIQSRAITDRTDVTQGCCFEHHSAPAAGSEAGYSVEVFNAIGETLTVLTLPESSLEALRRDEVLSVRSLDSHVA